LLLSLLALCLLFFVLPACNVGDDDDDSCAGVDCAPESAMALAFFDAAGPVVVDSVFWSLADGAPTTVECPDPTCNFGIGLEDGEYTFTATLDDWTQNHTVTLTHPEGDECCPGTLSESLEFYFIPDG
jgi:hypothetical protein